jgi:PAS domain S-box-containing protein
MIKFVSANESPYARRDPVSLMLDEGGMILGCSETCEELFGYDLHELTLQHVSTLFPQLAEIELVQKSRLNPLLVYLCHCGSLFRGQCKNGEILQRELSIVSLNHAGKRVVKLFVLQSPNAKHLRVAPEAPMHVRAK